MTATVRDWVLGGVYTITVAAATYILLRAIRWAVHEDFDSVADEFWVDEASDDV